MSADDHSDDIKQHSEAERGDEDDTSRDAPEHAQGKLAAGARAPDKSAGPSELPLLVESDHTQPSQRLSTWQKARDLTGRLRRGEGGSFFVWLRRTVRLWGFLAFVLIVLALFRRVVLPFVLATLV
ncbi:MAG: hypothetical protein KC503_04525, partial [Myxococcales bacterium]|nr:hypothetical protein [Myxococcales bacterium]